MFMQAICTHKITDKKFPLPKNRGLALPLCFVFAVAFLCGENDLGPLLLKQSNDHPGLSLINFCLLTVQSDEGIRSS